MPRRLRNGLKLRAIRFSLEARGWDGMKAMDIYRVHVSLRGIEPAIWRRIELSSQTTLKQLHHILQIAIGWEDSHLHEYIATGSATEAGSAV